MTSPPSPATNPRPTVLLMSHLRPTIEQSLSTHYTLLKPPDSVPSPAFLASVSPSVTVLLCPHNGRINSAVLDLLPNLRCVVATSVGVDNIDVAECRRRGVDVTNAGNAFTEDTADFAVGLVIGVTRRVAEADRYVRRRKWSVEAEFPLGFKLGGKQVGIIGLGSIGSTIAKRLEAFGCIVSYISRKAKPYVPYTYFSDIRELASHSDILIVCCALTEETKHIVNRDVLLALGKRGVIINVGRGALIDEKELVKCLVAGEIGGAGLDVFENEPQVPPELFSLDNVVLTPHSAMLTPESFSSQLHVVMGNLEAFFSNKPLLSPVLD